MEKKDILEMFVERFCESEDLTLCKTADGGHVLAIGGLDLIQAIEREADGPAVHLFALHVDGERPTEKDFLRAMARACAQLAARFGIEHGESLFECYTKLGFAFHVVEVHGEAGEDAAVIRHALVSVFDGCEVE